MGNKLTLKQAIEEIETGITACAIDTTTGKVSVAEGFARLAYGVALVCSMCDDPEGLGVLACKVIQFHLKQSLKRKEGKEVGNA